MKSEEKAVSTFMNMLTEHPYLRRNEALGKLFDHALELMPDASYVTIKVSKWVEGKERIKPEHNHTTADIKTDKSCPACHMICLEGFQ